MKELREAIKKLAQATNGKGGGAAVAQLVEAMRYKPEGRGFDSPCWHLNFSHLILSTDYGPVDDTASNRNECQKHFLAGKSGRCVRLKP